MIDVQTNSIEADFGRKPNQNTILYCPFDEDLTDHSGKGNSVTIGKSSVSITTLNSIKCAYFNGGILDTNIVDNTFDRTAAAWVYVVSGECMIINSNPCGVFNGKSLIRASNMINYSRYNGSSYGGEKSAPGLTNGRHLIGFSGKKVYIDGQLFWDGSSVGGSIGGSRYFSINGHAQGSSCSRRAGVEYMKYVIIEEGIRSDDDWLKYYNRSKKFFGIN